MEGGGNSGLADSSAATAATTEQGHAVPNPPASLTPSKIISNAFNNLSLSTQQASGSRQAPPQSPIPSSFKPISAWTQTKVLLWKDLVLRRRAPFNTLSLLVTPLIVPYLFTLADDDPSNASQTGFIPFLTRAAISCVAALSRIDSQSASQYIYRLYDIPAGSGSDTTSSIPAEMAALFRILLAFYLIFGFNTHQQLAMIEIVSEKEKRIREGLLMQGTSPKAYWASKSLLYSAFSVITVSIMAVLIRPCFPASNPAIVALLIIAYDLANIAFGYVFTPIIRSTKSAAVFSGLLPYFFGMLTGLAFALEWVPTEFGLLMAAIPMYPLALFFGILKLHQLELRGTGATFANLFHGEGVGWYIVVLLVSCSLYSLLAFYLDQVVPQPYGTPRPWNFIFQKRDTNENSPSSHSQEEQERNPDFEPDPTDRQCVVNLQHICRMFGVVKAVDDVSLKLYQDEIFALMGHNGAGKSTLINILTGLVASSDGSGSVSGLNLKTQISKIRRLIGVCPQFDIHYEDLTVREHVLLFAGLKGLWESSDIAALATEALSELSLTSRATDYAKTLSGGEKRKLSLAMAVVGSPKLLVLDEPTSGMDPMSRRTLWKLLEGKKRGRVTLFTTHQMDEADILADRKAFMVAGRVRCMGTSIFLKSRFNISYSLNVIHPLNYASQTIKSIVHKHFPLVAQPVTRVTDTDTSMELNFAIPVLSAGAVFPHLLADLDAICKQHHGIYYGVSAPKLEEVFLQSNSHASSETNDSEDDIGSDGSTEAAPLLGLNGIAPVSKVKLVTHVARYRLLLAFRSPTTLIINFLSALYFTIIVFDSVRIAHESGDMLSAGSTLWIISVGLINISLYFARETVKERESKIVALMKITLSGGVGATKDRTRYIWAYWGGGWVSQLCFSAGLVAVVLGAAVWMHAGAVLGNALPMFVSVLIVSFMTWPILCYSLSLMFAKPDTFTIATSVVLSAIALFPYLFAMYMDLFGQPDFLFYHLIFSFLVPTYNLPMVIYLMIVSLERSGEDSLPVMFYFNWSNHILPCLVGILFQFACASAVLFVIEYVGFDWWRRISSQLLWKYETFPPTTDPGDDDVAEERRRIEDLPTDIGSNSGVILQNVTKRFRVWRSLIKPSPPNGSRPPSRQVPDVENPDEHNVTSPSSTGDNENAVEIDSPGLWNLYKRRTAVNRVSFQVRKSEIFSMLGPNGAGKSTTMSMAIGELHPTNGKIWSLDQTMEVGFCPQADALWPNLTISENLHFYGMIKGVVNMEAWINRRAGKKLGMKEHLNKSVKQLSGGTKRKASFAISVLGSPEVLFLDEPSSGVDPSARRSMWDLLTDKQSDMVTLLNTHSMDEAEALSSRIGIMVNGSLHCIGSPQHLKRKYGVGYVLELHTRPAGWHATKRWVQSKFPAAKLLEVFEGIMMRWEIPKNAVEGTWGGMGNVFKELERLKQVNLVEHGKASSSSKPDVIVQDYSLGQTTLEMVFMRFAQQQVVLD